MKIVVLVKEVPDTNEDRKLNLETGLADRAASEAVIDEIGGRAVEVALKYAEADPDATDTEVTLLTMGPQTAETNIRKVLAMGAHGAIHISDERLSGADLGLTAEVIAAALRDEGFDLVIAGNQSTDGVGGMLPAMVAQLLGLPALIDLDSVSIGPESVSGEQTSGGITRTLSVALPAVISITEQLPDARFPSFKGIMAAKKKPIVSKNLDDLGVTFDELAVPHVIMTAISQTPPREAGVKLTASEEAVEELADFLDQKHFI